MSKRGGYTRPQGKVLAQRLRESRRFIIAVTGSRQVGKTTLVRQIVDELGQPCTYVSADQPSVRDAVWLEQQWQAARVEAENSGGAILVVDEVQKVDQWSEIVKRLWDEDTSIEIPLKVVVLGSAPLLVERGLTESLAGRFEVLRLPHWSFAEMREAFGWSLDQFLYFGGYPGAAPLIEDESRWVSYILDSLIETTISRDVLLHTRVDKPALLRRLFELGCSYSGQILSYNKMLGQLTGAGNTTTLAHYLELLSAAGTLTGLQRYAGGKARRRSSSPKLQVLNTALLTAQSGMDFNAALGDRVFWGRLVESAVGAHLAAEAVPGRYRLYYWRYRNAEVDFVVESGRSLTAIEVKSGRVRDRPAGIAAFLKQFGSARSLLVGSGGIPVEEFLEPPVERWIA